MARPNIASSGQRLRRSRRQRVLPEVARYWEGVSVVPPLPLSHTVRYYEGRELNETGRCV